MEQRDIIHQYLKELERYLARLEKAQAQEVLREIESHIFDALEQQQSSGQVEDASAILRGFGEPRQLAFAYVAHVTDGAPPPAGFKAIQKVKQGVTATLYYAMAAFGFSIAFMFLVGLTIALIAFTPLKYYIPGYGTKESRSALELLKIRTDSLEQAVHFKEQYIEGIKKVLSEGNPQQLDTIPLVLPESLPSLD